MPWGVRPLDQRARFEYQPTKATEMLVAVRNVAAQQLKPRGAGHHLEIALHFLPLVSQPE